MRHFRDALLAARRANGLLSVSMWHMYSNYSTAFPRKFDARDCLDEFVFPCRDVTSLDVMR